MNLICVAALVDGATKKMHDLLPHHAGCDSHSFVLLAVHFFGGVTRNKKRRLHALTHHAGRDGQSSRKERSNEGDHHFMLQTVTPEMMHYLLSHHAGREGLSSRKEQSNEGDSFFFCFSVEHKKNTAYILTPCRA